MKWEIFAACPTPGETKLMRIYNLRTRIARKIAACVFAACGCFSTTFLYSFDNIALGDPSFEAFVVPASGYAYADSFRPTSAWIDDQDSPGGYIQDDADSNWLYSAAYATGFRPTPRTDDQAMHGYAHYSTQEAAAVFEAGRTYTFSVWAQGDNDATDSSSRIYLYLFDGSEAFSQANALTFARYAPDTGDFLNRDVAWTDAQSMAGWTQINISHTVLAGAAEIGSPIGVGFWAAGDGAVDDALLTSSIPEPTSVILLGMGGLTLLTTRRKRE